jgi:uncharacterized protein (TIGR03118 family)
MKSKTKIYSGVLMVFLSFLIFTTGCKKSSTTTSSSGPAFTVVNLVADAGSFTGAKIDPNLVNAWGVAISPSGKIWVSSTGKGVTTIYDGTGATLIAPIEIPADGGRASSGPTGAIFNNTSDFVIPADNSVSKFIYVNLDGTISAWSSGTAAKTVANRSAQGASYTGATLGKVGSANYLYAANFAGGKVDVFTSSFTYNISFSFIDPNLPQGFAPYNIANIGGDLYVTYAPTNYNANGNGMVSVFSPDGTFIKRFATNGTLNFPWGIAVAPAGFGLGLNMILVGNFGDGTISIFDQNGNYKGQLQSGGNPISIDGLWSLTPAPSTATTLDQNVVYFSAGPNFQGHGLLGYLKLVPPATTTGGGGY